VPVHWKAAPEGFVILAEAAARLGTTRRLLARRIAAGELATYVDPLDHRRRLVAIADLDAYTAPQPIRGPTNSTGRAVDALAEEVGHDRSA
jgi:hypothetical protein